MHVGHVWVTWKVGFELLELLLMVRMLTLLKLTAGWLRGWS